MSELTVEKLKKIKGLFAQAEVPKKGFVWNPVARKVEPYDITKNPTKKGR